MKDHSVARIVGLGSYLPPHILTNQNLEELVDTSDEWIVSRTGIKERRIAAKNQFTSDMGAEAALKALQDASVSVEEIDLIIVATMSPDYLSPSTANLIQSLIGARQAASFDIQAACTGFLYALSVAKAYVESSMYKNVLVIASEKMSAFMDYKDRTTCVIFGDGAGAAVVSNKGAGFAISSISLGSEGDLAGLALIPGGGSRCPASQESVMGSQHFFKMNGQEIFKHAVRKMGHAAETCLKEAHLLESDISWLIPHQANKRIVDALAKQFKIQNEKVYLTLQKYGNTSASSVVIALDELIKTHTFKEKEHLLLTAFGGGLTWGAAVLTYRND